MTDEWMKFGKQFHRSQDSFSLTHSAKIAISLSISTASPPMIAEKGEMESAVPAIPLVLLFRLDGPRQIWSLGVMCYHDE